ncbi:histidine phosphatase family protein [Yoonia sp. BS5-3]|uniref:Histidine phosphatase family protein n=1 Tax=Yoonia phaeophyticola TaxID=3137369 RepID=A0ABZ2V8F6_9RHOB
MTKRLILIRHAKSSWNDPSEDDHARVLNKRGRASAIAISDWLAAKGYIPGHVLCSDAARTQETAALILDRLSPKPELHLSGMLYHAAPGTLLEMIQRETADHLALIGHNPGIGLLAKGLAQDGPDHHRFNDYPTCATTVLECDIGTWAELDAGMCSCRDFVVPRDLIGTTGQDID